MDRKLLKLPFSLNRTPFWVCPTCLKGVLQIKKDTFAKEERRDSRNHSHEAWEPEWIEYVYTCLLECTNDQCKEVVASTGIGSVESDLYQDSKGDLAQDFSELFTPKYFEPHLRLFTIPTGCAKSVSIPLNESFRLFFSTPSAASNNVRIAIENLLTELKVRRFNVVRGRRQFVNLHQRINLIPPKFAHLKEFFLAIKWLGNAGSHATGEDVIAVSLDDVMDAYELTDQILQEIYAPKTKRLTTLAKKINKKKGPAK